MKTQSRILSQSQPITCIEENGQLSQGFTKQYSIHYPDKLFRIMGNNIFHKADFLVGNKNSILFLTKDGKLESPTIETVIQNHEDYAILYPIPIIQQDKLGINHLEVYSKKECKEYNYKLTFENGLDVGKCMYNNTIPDKFEFGIKEENGIWWPNKNVLVNTNSEFICGILLGYLNQNIQNKINMFYIKNTHNSYLFANILNLMGANYKIKRLSNPIKLFDKVLEISLPMIFNRGIVKEYLIKNPILQRVFRNSEFFFTPNSEKMDYKHFNKLYKNKAPKNSFNENVINGEYLIIPTFKLSFVPVKQDGSKELYDFTSNNPDMNNFSFLFTPMMKNSDGDILTNTAIHTKEGNEDLKENFQPSNKKWFANLNNAELNNYISDYALLGLFSVTKHLDN